MSNKQFLVAAKTEQRVRRVLNPPSHTARAKARGQEKENQGGDSAWDPPLPIPNREVKPRRADGTAEAGE